MDFRGVLIAGLFFAAVLGHADEEAETLFRQSAKLFALENVRFEVHSTLSAREHRTERTFMVARRTDGDTSALLIRFIAPKTIECTAVLTLDTPEGSEHYVYFPSLKRVRMIPKTEEDSEVVGLGISYRELDTHRGDFDPVESVDYLGKPHYRIVRHTEKSRSVYLIDPASLAIRHIDIFDKELLKKEVIIDEIGSHGGKPFITAWRVLDKIREQELAYRIDLDSISEAPQASLFHRNRLERCSH